MGGFRFCYEYYCFNNLGWKVKGIAKTIINGLLKILEKEEAQEFLLEKAAELAKKTKTEIDDHAVGFFRKIWESWRKI
jgi:hypothetical protein